MKIGPVQGELLRVFINETSRYNGKPLVHAIVERARDAHMAGATVFKSPMGFGTHRTVHTDRLVEVSLDMPMVIEIVDAENRLDAFMPLLDEMITEGIVTREPIEVIRYHSEEKK